MSGDDTASLIYLLVLGVAISAWVFARYRHRLTQALQQALLWVLLFLGVVVLYGFKDDLQSTVFPRQAAVFDGERFALARAADRHFYLTLDVNGVDIDFVIDTGATGVVLSRADAQAVGFEPENLLYLGIANTANGQVRTARVKLKTVRLGDFADQNVTAWVNDGELDTSLLGMTYLSRFSSIEITGDTLFLTR